MAGTFIQRARALYVCLGIAVFAHNAVGIIMTVRLFGAARASVLDVGSFLPYCAIAVLMAVSIVLGLTRFWRWGAVLVSVGLAALVALCAYDLSHNRAQFGGGGTGNTYTLWWWYYEPFWYGYRPGNV